MMAARGRLWALVAAIVDRLRHMPRAVDWRRCACGREYEATRTDQQTCTQCAQPEARPPGAS